MKNFTALLLLAMLTFGVVAQPTDALAKSSNSGSSHHDEDEDDGDHRGHGRDGDDRDDDEDSASSTIEAEANVFTDTTIVKVELGNGQKNRFSTTANTRDTVIDEIVNRLGLDRAEVDSVLDFEVEDRASRAKDRKGFNGLINSLRDKDITCVATTSALKVEADVFTDTTIVKVGQNGSTTVFETDATTTDAIVTAVATKLSLTESDVRAVLKLDVEDRASKASDLTVRTEKKKCEKERTESHTSTSTPNTRDLQSKIAQLQSLLETLIRLFNQQFGTAN